MVAMGREGEQSPSTIEVIINQAYVDGDLTIGEHDELLGYVHDADLSRAIDLLLCIIKRCGGAIRNARLKN